MYRSKTENTDRLQHSLAKAKWQSANVSNHLFDFCDHLLNKSLRERREDRINKTEGLQGILVEISNKSQKQINAMVFSHNFIMSLVTTSTTKRRPTQA